MAVAFAHDSPGNPTTGTLEALLHSNHNHNGTICTHRDKTHLNIICQMPHDG